MREELCVAMLWHIGTIKGTTLTNKVKQIPGLDQNVWIPLKLVV